MFCNHLNGKCQSTTLLGSGQFQRLLDQITQVIAQLPQVVKNAHERIIGGRPVANADKIHSLYDEHVNVIVRHKTSAHVEFGNTLLLAFIPMEDLIVPSTHIARTPK